MRRRYTLLELIVTIALVATVATFLALSHKHGRRAHYGRTKCPNSLRQLGLAALQYGDDKRFLPHNKGILELDGDATTNDSTKIARALLWYGYHDNPEGWICPGSDDAYVPIQDAETRENMRHWFWRGEKRGDLKRSPFADDAPDPALLDTPELSYGWTRKGMNQNVASTAILGADRAARGDESDCACAGTHTPAPGSVGNHQEGWNVLKADGTVDWITTGHDPDGSGRRVGVAWLRGTGKNDGYLAIANQQF